MDKKIWAYPIKKEHRKVVYFMSFLAISTSIYEGWQSSYINTLWLIPLSLTVVYAGFICGGYLNKWFDKKAKD